MSNHIYLETIEEMAKTVAELMRESITFSVRFHDGKYDIELTGF